MDYYEKRMLEIGEMTSTPIKREGLNGLSNSEKITMLYELTDSKDFICLLEFIKSSYDDADYCNSYR